MVNKQIQKKNCVAALPSQDFLKYERNDDILTAELPCSWMAMQSFPFYERVFFSG